MKQLTLHILCLLLFVGCKENKTFTPSIAEVSITLKKEAIQAGTPLLFDIQSTTGVDELIVQLDHFWFTKTWFLPDLKKGASFEIPSTALEYSGIHQIKIRHHQKEIARIPFEVTPLKIQNPITSLNGPKSIWIENRQQSMITSLPKDTFYNPGPEGAPLLHQIKYSDGRVMTKEIAIKNQVAYSLFSGGIKTGKIKAGISTIDAHGKETHTQAIGLPPTSIQLKVEKHVSFADPRESVIIRTNPLQDQYGNLVPDGTMVYINVQTNKETQSAYQSITIDGVAKVWLRNPAYSSIWIVKGHVGSIQSEPIVLKFHSNLQKITTAFDSNLLELKVGPLVGHLNQYIADGMDVSLLIDDQILRQETQDGFVRFNLKQLGLHRNEYSAKIMVADKQQIINIKM